MDLVSWEWIKDNYVNVFQILFALVVLGEAVTAITPTKTDDGFVKRLGNGIDKIAEMLKIPNNVKKG